MRVSKNTIQLAKQKIRDFGNIINEDQVVFSDEKTFQSSHSGRLRVYRPVGTRYDEQYVRTYNQSGRFSVNLWAWISSRGPGICTIVEERLNAPVYVRILNELMLPSVIPIFGEQNFIFQDDNCPIHRARIVRQYLEQERVNCLPWPSKSPDLNPIENVWGRMTSLMYENDFRPNTVEELQQKIVDTWQQITPAYTRDLVSSMPRRLQMVIDSNGAMTNSTGERVSVGLAAETDGLSKAHTLAVAVFLCGDCGRAVHPKLHTGLLQVLLEHPTQSRNVAL
ncbi:hypothetical protein GEV33_003824 [Tenebrio molitor]|uniref:Tc1-like transposase DDE domain-containing protein n=1 Tax=Tenebrio molitor TaxID=7067 RepID=A0A8J6HRF2_TENMO|nr:hypothetical protein GEV33_003824 [Tenebrio molitor]